MKTYEEMARDVLRRRDEELSSITQASQLQSQINPPPEVVYPAAPKKRGKLGLLPKIAIPCAATVLAGVVGLNVWKNVRGSQKPNQTMNLAAEDNPNTPPAEEGDYTFQIYYEKTESIYKGGDTHISINRADNWNVYHLPLLSQEDFRPIDDDKINNYYGMEFDRLSTLFPEWNGTHEQFGTYEHDENDSFVASHAVLSSTNSISYTPTTGGRVEVSASYQSYPSASVSNAAASIINGFDAMVYSIPINEEFAADIQMWNVNITIRTSYVDELEFFRILDMYTMPNPTREIYEHYFDGNQNHTQTTEDKIVILDNRPDFILKDIHYEPYYTDYSLNPEVIWRKYSVEELKAVYGLDFMCLSELHPDWRARYDELGFGVYYKMERGALGWDIPQNRKILEARNKVSYDISEDYSVTIIARLGKIPNRDVEHSVINGYDAIIFRESPQHNIFGAIINMDGTLICATMEMTTSKTESGEEFVDLLREYTSEAAKYVKPESITPSEFTGFKAVDAVDDCCITYEFNWDVEPYWWMTSSVGTRWDILEYDEADYCFGYLSNFFETDAMPVDEQYSVNFMRRRVNGEFTCSTAEGAKAYTPVDGKVVGAWYGYNRGFGNSVAVEFGDGKFFFIIGHLDEIDVKTGDTVKAGDVLGVCGYSGAVVVDENSALLSLIAFRKVD